VSSYGVELMLFNVFGPRQAFLTDPKVQKVAATLSVSPAMLALKWAENQGARIVMPHLPDTYDEESKEPHDTLKVQPHEQDVKTRGDSSSDDDDAGVPEVRSERVIVHRKFVTNYRNAPDAATCAHAMATALAEMGRLSNLVSAQHLEDANQCPSSATQVIRRRHSISVADRCEEDRSGETARRTPLHVANGKSADKRPKLDQRQRRHLISDGVPQNGTPRQTRDVTRFVSHPLPTDGKSTNGSLRRRNLVNGELDGGTHQRNTAKPPVVARRKSVSGTGWALEEGSPLPTHGKSSNWSPRRRGLLTVTDSQSVNGEMDRWTPQPNKSRTAMFARRNSVPGMLPGSQDRPASAFDVSHRSKDKALSALRISSPKQSKCCFCGTRADGELPEMVVQIVERLLKEGMAIEKVAEIIGVGQAMIEKIALKPALVTLGIGDGKTTESEAEAVTGNITTAANWVLSKDTASERSGFTSAESADESTDVRITGFEDSALGG